MKNFSPYKEAAVNMPAKSPGNSYSQSQSSAFSHKEKLCYMLELIAGATFVDGNAVTRLQNGERIFPAMLHDIHAATESIDFITFVYWQGHIAVDFAQALSARAEAGVKVRVLLDAIGAFQMNDKLVNMMKRSGVDVRFFRPVAHWKIWKLDNRSHRKVLVCDRKVAFTGGVGIAEEWQGDARNPGEWRDTHFRITGPAVTSIHSAFISNWSETTDFPEPLNQPCMHLSRTGRSRILTIASPSSLQWSKIALMFRTLIGSATDSLSIATAYFVPDPSLVELICAAAKRGVHVRILVPGEHTDSRLSQVSGREMFQRLLDAGVLLYRYRPTMMHAKILLVDNCLAVVGSANMNHRSMSKDEECCLVIDDADVVNTLQADFDNDIEKSDSFDLDRFKDRSIWLKMTEKFVYLFRHEL